MWYLPSTAILCVPGISIILMLSYRSPESDRLTELGHSIQWLQLFLGLGRYSSVILMNAAL
jgi:hypothetical protein